MGVKRIASSIRILFIRLQGANIHRDTLPEGDGIEIGFRADTIRNSNKLVKAILYESVSSQTYTASLI